jgi:hypothetical protein
MCPIERSRLDIKIYQDTNPGRRPRESSICLRKVHKRFVRVVKSSDMWGSRKSRGQRIEKKWIERLFQPDTSKGRESLWEHETPSVCRWDIEFHFQTITLEPIMY